MSELRLHYKSSTACKIMTITFYLKFFSLAYLPLLFTASFTDFDNGEGFLSAIAFFPNG